MNRTDVEFLSGSQRCAGWLYRPEDTGAATAPLVVMGHGLGLDRQSGLEKYARRFADAGIAVLVFDYRHFGDSEGEPRQLLDIKKQRADFHAAVAFARALDGIDPRRIAVWGSSFGGGHALSVAQEDPSIAAVVAQCPFTDGIASALALGPVSVTKVGLLGIADLVRSGLGGEPVMVALAGKPGSGALMAADDVVPGYGRLAKESPLHKPEVAARFGLHILFDAPKRKTADLRMPVLFAVCDADTVAPPTPTVRAAEKLPNAVLLRYPVGHFDIYYDDAYEAAVADQVEFLVANLEP